MIINEKDEQIEKCEKINFDEYSNNFCDEIPLWKYINGFRKMHSIEYLGYSIEYIWS